MEVFTTVELVHHNKRLCLRRYQRHRLHHHSQSSSSRMARTKSTHHRSPGSLYEAARDIPRLLSRHATTPALQQQLLRVADPIPTDWISERLKAHKPKHQRELEKAYGIITAALNDPASVAVKGLQWAKEIAEKEKELEAAENETLSADSEGNVYGDRDGKIFHYIP
jgi:hypothetical protein